MGKEIVRKDNYGASECLARGVLGDAANVEAAFGIVFSLCGNSSVSPPACGR